MLLLCLRPLLPQPSLKEQDGAVAVKARAGRERHLGPAALPAALPAAVVVDSSDNKAALEVGVFILLLRKGRIDNIEVEGGMSKRPGVLETSICEVCIVLLQDGVKQQRARGGGWVGRKRPAFQGT